MTMESELSLRLKVVGAFLIGCAVGGILAAFGDYMVLPKDRVTASNQIAAANSLAASYARSADDLRSQLATAQQATRDAQAALSQAKSQLEVEKSAKPDRYKVVKEGVRTNTVCARCSGKAVCLAPAWRDF